MITIPNNLGQGGSKVNESLKGLLQELQGLTFTVVAGAAAGTKMNIAAMRTEDTIVSALNLTDSAEDKANVMIQSTKGSGTATLSTAVAGNIVTIAGKAFTFKAAADADPVKRWVSLGASDTEAAANLAAAVNMEGCGVHATSSGAVVTFTADADGTAGNAITLTKTGSPITVSGATLAGGTATGGIKSTTNLTGKTMLVVWFNKQ